MDDAVIENLEFDSEEIIYTCDKCRYTGYTHFIPPFINCNKKEHVYTFKVTCFKCKAVYKVQIKFKLKLVSIKVEEYDGQKS